MKRTFALAGSPPRFWEVTLDDTVVALRWGTAGRAAQRFERTFASERDARAYVEQQIAAQLAKGYVETTPAPTGDAPPAEVAVKRRQRFVWKRDRFLEITQEGRRITLHGGPLVAGRVPPDRDLLSEDTYDTVAQASRIFDEQCAEARYDGGAALLDERTCAVHANPALEAQCLDAPDDPAPWMIYADWLIAQGDPRGEIAALQLAGKPDEAQSVLNAHVVELCGTVEGSIALEFRHGFAVGATLHANTDDAELLEDVTRAFLASPMARFVEALRFGLAARSGDNDWAPTLQLVCESPRAPHVRALRFDAYTREDSELSWTPYGDFAFAWPRLPALELLHIKSGAGGTLGALVLPRLKTFIRESGGLARDEIAAIVRATWPALEHLEIWFGSSDYGAEADLASIAPILDGTGLPNLRHLGIVNCELVDAVIAELPHRRLLPQLRTLDLSKGVMARAATALLVANAAAFRHLDWIDLDANLLTPDEVAQITAALPNVRPGTQRERDDADDAGDDADEAARYVAVGE